ncbi:patatin-like phospholipase family protein [Thermosediminibacter oceani]|uniref:Patatin n=1 Tax=Thermosediminibacter oceani (strain ATCC BAA-1034 / DSM 16646 / JW/IW-1228P) TaxID=555079 RepID=D9S0J3_THEOJ|nr:patatin-like phospholipase family protein [Thermosediminibacter oceani]ADL08851.1 Patatin [Thermosediminibacter oceani DSM 16646]
MLKKQYRFGLVLSGGGLRGAVHLGILKALMKNGFYPDILAGTSAGSIAAAFYACEVDIDWFASRVSSLKPWRLLDPTFPPAAVFTLVYYFWTRRRPMVMRKWPDGLFNGDKIEKYLDRLFGGRTFDDLRVPISVVSADVETGETVVFCPRENIPMGGMRNTVFISDAPVSAAVRASISLPGIFVPKRLAGRKLVDGGIKNNVPVDVLYHQGALKILAVDLGRSTGRRRVDTAMDVLMASVDIMGDELCYYIQKEYPAFYVYPQVQGVGYTDFYRIPELIKFGEDFASRNMNEIEKFLCS